MGELTNPMQFNNKNNEPIFDFSLDLINLFSSEASKNETIHSAQSDNLNYIRNTENALNIYKLQIVLNKSEKEIRTTKIMYKKKIRHVIQTKGNNTDLLEILRDILPEKGLVAILCEDINLNVRFQECYRQYFAYNVNIKTIRSFTLLKDITDIEEKFKNNKRRTFKKQL